MLAVLRQSHTQWYEPRKPDTDCYVDNKDNYQCTGEDYKCDYTVQNKIAFCSARVDSC